MLILEELLKRMDSSKQIKSSVIAKSMRFNGIFQPLHQETLRVIDKHNQSKEFVQKWNSKSNSDFSVIPTKELCRAYLQKPDLLASKGVIRAKSSPPHSMKSVGFKVYREIANQRKFCRRYDVQNLKSKLRHYTSVDSLRCFSPLGFGSDSQLRDRKKGQYISHEKKSKEMKGGVVSEVGSMLKVCTSRDKVAGDVKLRHVASSGFISKDGNEDSLDCSNESPKCQSNSEETHQPSPVSVLEPICMEDMLDDSEEPPYLDLYGIIRIYVSFYKSVVESETKESKHSEPIGFLDSQERRDSSYIDDILTEVVPGDSLDLAISLKIFEKLEKKYYTETSWKRSERRILFDRVNSGLVKILESFTAIPTWKKPVSRRLGTVLSICRLKQELWKVLARQEKQPKKDLLAKVPVIYIDEWLELEADDESVVYELESMIVDDLLDEVISFM